MKILILGGSGQAGSGIKESLLKSSHVDDLLLPSKSELNLVDDKAVLSFFKSRKFSAVVMAAGRVGGIEFNQSNQAAQYFENMRMNENVLKSALYTGVEKVILLSSTCIYPTQAKLPMLEDDIFGGEPEITNLGYANAKLAAIRQLEMTNKLFGFNWKIMIPANLYGNPTTFVRDTHVVPMLMKKFIKNEEMIEIWGDGTPIRQFLHYRDLGGAVEFVLRNWNLPTRINVAPKEHVRISELVKILSEIYGFTGKITYNSSKPNGHPNKSVSDKILKTAGWIPEIDLKTGIIELAESVSGY